MSTDCIVQKLHTAIEFAASRLESDDVEFTEPRCIWDVSNMVEFFKMKKRMTALEGEFYDEMTEELSERQEAMPKLLKAMKKMHSNMSIIQDDIKAANEYYDEYLQITETEAREFDTIEDKVQWLNVNAASDALMYNAEGEKEKAKSLALIRLECEQVLHNFEKLTKFVNNRVEKVMKQLNEWDEEVQKTVNLLSWKFGYQESYPYAPDSVE